jgi:hypothetical protein
LLRLSTEIRVEIVVWIVLRGSLHLGTERIHNACEFASRDLSMLQSKWWTGLFSDLLIEDDCFMNSKVRQNFLTHFLIHIWNSLGQCFQTICSKVL